MWHSEPSEIAITSSFHLLSRTPPVRPVRYILYHYFISAANRSPSPHCLLQLRDTSSSRIANLNNKFWSTLDVEFFGGPVSGCLFWKLSRFDWCWFSRGYPPICDIIFAVLLSAFSIRPPAGFTGICAMDTMYLTVFIQDNALGMDKIFLFFSVSSFLDLDLVYTISQTWITAWTIFLLSFLFIPSIITNWLRLSYGTFFSYWIILKYAVLFQILIVELKFQISMGHDGNHIDSSNYITQFSWRQILPFLELVCVASYTQTYCFIESGRYLIQPFSKDCNVSW